MSKIDKNKVRAAFNRAANSYDALADFQHRVCECLLERLPSNLSPPSILDGGCGTGYGASLLQKRWPEADIIGCDLAPEMVRKTQARGITAVCGDLEHLPFDDAHFDLLWSSLALQWCDPVHAFTELHRTLKAKGVLACSTLTNGTLHELETAFAGIDNYRRVLDFQSVTQTKAALGAAGFVDVEVVQKTFVTRHANFRNMLETIRGIGAGQSGPDRRRTLMGKTAWQTVQSRFDAMRDENGMLPATYDVLFILARKT